MPDSYKEEIKNKSIVLPNGIDNFWINNKVDKKEQPIKNKIKIIYVGVINSNKNIETTIMACKKLIKLGYEVSYTIVGKIVENKYYNLIKKYSFIKYIPHCKKEELIIHYRQANIFIMPSKHETFGLVYAEAMSQGLPVIYTRGQGFDGQFSEGEVGYSIQYDSVDEIIIKIKDILNKYELISNNCVQEVVKFDWDKISREYTRIYEIINQKI